MVRGTAINFYGGDISLGLCKDKGIVRMSGHEPRSGGPRGAFVLGEIAVRLTAMIVLIGALLSSSPG